MQEASSYSTAPNTARTISFKACNSPVQYTGREFKHGITESEAKMFNTNIQRECPGGGNMCSRRNE